MTEEQRKTEKRKLARFRDRQTKHSPLWSLTNRAIDALDRGDMAALGNYLKQIEVEQAA